MGSPYTKRQRAAIHEALQLPLHDSKRRVATRKITTAVRGYLFFTDFERGPRQKRKTQRAHLDQIRKKAKSLEKLMRQLEVDTEQALSQFDTITADDLSLLDAALGELLRRFPASGKRPEKARWFLVRDLAEIYAALSGRKATRRTMWQSGKAYGPFREFVVAVLEPVNANAVKGIDDVIKSVLSTMGKDRHQN